MEVIRIEWEIFVDLKANSTCDFIFEKIVGVRMLSYFYFGEDPEFIFFLKLFKDSDSWLNFTSSTFYFILKLS